MADSELGYTLPSSDSDIFRFSFSVVDSDDYILHGEERYLSEDCIYSFLGNIAYYVRSLSFEWLVVDIKFPDGFSSEMNYSFDALNKLFK